MGYIENNLVKGEEVIYITKLHWWAIVGPAVNFIVALLIIGACVFSGSTTSSGGGSFLLGFIGIVMAIIIAAMGYLNYISSEFGLTNRRILIKSGFIRRQTLELNLNKIESFQVQESLIGRIMGYKNLRITGSGGTKQRFNWVADADRFRKHVVEHSTEN
ncbi:MAG: PH domain-containing protein [Anaerolineae bacterium]|nr:PH domain-containing protein [Anaerolineae bacterium]